jgi:hypothetical protein
MDADCVLNPKRRCRIGLNREPIQRAHGTLRQIGIPAAFGALSDMSV